ncbi:MAG TPA: hypothetical protein DCY13_00550 [Verrucomicrobiales bacterium]|nr:hypothetical protein [Verrucomicrobiales bacterium]
MWTPDTEFLVYPLHNYRSDDEHGTCRWNSNAESNESSSFVNATADKNDDKKNYGQQWNRNADEPEEM